tara:strand:- start:29566 stop:29769 length:204 start_codon:yes stop_codon:yes gene_type:complete
MKKVIIASLVALSLLLSGCQSFQKDRDLELYLVGAALSYAIGKHVCRKSEFRENCGVGAAAAFVLWY